MSTIQKERLQTALPAGIWRVDGAHSNVEFGIKHLLITTVSGRFADFDGAIEVDEHGEAKARGTIRAASISTNEEQRDEHLRSPDFFDAAGFPGIRFESKRIESAGGARFRVVGELEIKGVKREVELEAEFTGEAKDPYGNERIGLAVRGQLDPNDYGVDWNQELETGGNLIGDKVDFTANISAVRAES